MELIKILVPIDFEAQSIQAIKQAVVVSRGYNTQITLLYVHQDKGILTKLFSSEQYEVFDNSVLNMLNDKKLEFGDGGKVNIEVDLIHGSSVHESIVGYANENKFSMIIMGKGYKEGVSFIGSITSRVLRYSTMPVITVGEKRFSEHFSKILLPMDLTKETKQKVGWGMRLAKTFGAELVLFSALWSKNDRNIVFQLKQQLKQVMVVAEKEGVKCSYEIFDDAKSENDFVPAILEYISTNNDISITLIMTQQENSITEFFMGSHASELIRNSELPVMSIVPKDTGEIMWGF